MESFAFPNKAERVVLMVGLSISNIANYNNIFRLKSVHVTNPKGFTVD